MLVLQHSMVNRNRKPQEKEEYLNKQVFEEIKESKMHTWENTRSRNAIALVLAGLFALFCFGIGATVAYADPVTAGTGQVVINPATGSSTTQYNAYQIFTADINDTTNQASNVAWANDATKTAVVSYLGQSTPERTQSYDAYIQASGYMRGTTVSSDDRNDPSNALGYITSEWGTASGANPAGGSFEQGLANAVTAASGTVKDTVAAQTAWSGHGDSNGTGGADGWYLFTTQTAGAADMHTNAIFAPVGGQGQDITEKTSPVTFNKQVKEDAATPTWGKVADAEVGSDVDYKLTFTLPTNYADYASYALSFADTPASGLVIKPSTVKVYVNSTQLAAANYNDTTTTSALSVAITDLKTAAPAAAAGQSVTVEYSATITATAAEAPVSNVNSATATYTNDPLTLGTGTKDSTAKVYDYAITIQKTGEGNIPLKGAKFKITQGAPTSGSTNYFNATTNTWTNDVATATEFETNDAGTFSVSGLDANTAYYLIETQAPNQYTLLSDPVQITLTPTYDANGALTALTATPVGGTVQVTTITPGANAGDDSTGGAVTLTVANSKNPVTFALTGGLGPAVIVGAIIIVGGVVLFVSSRKKREDKDGQAQDVE